VHHRLSAQEAKIYEGGVAEYRRLKLLQRRMEDTSRRAALARRLQATQNTSDERRHKLPASEVRNEGKQERMLFETAGTTPALHLHRP